MDRICRQDFLALQLTHVVLFCVFVYTRYVSQCTDLASNLVWNFMYLKDLQVLDILALRFQQLEHDLVARVPGCIWIRVPV